MRLVGRMETIAAVAGWAGLLVLQPELTGDEKRKARAFQRRK